GRAMRPMALTSAAGPRPELRLRAPALQDGLLALGLQRRQLPLEGLDAGDGPAKLAAGRHVHGLQGLSHGDVHALLPLHRGLHGLDEVRVLHQLLGDLVEDRLAAGAPTIEDAVLIAHGSPPARAALAAGERGTLRGPPRPRGAHGTPRPPSSPLRAPCGTRSPRWP